MYRNNALAVVPYRR